MRGLNSRKPRIAGLLALALGAVALLALSGVAAARDHGSGHGRHHDHHHSQLPMNGAGTIWSFDVATGKLTIALTGGGSAIALVTEETRIQCEEFEGRRLQRRDHGGSGSSGSDDNDFGDDNGGGGNEPGDDNGGESSGPGPSGESGPPVEGASGEGPTCTVASLVPGVVVSEAEVHREGGVLIFEKVDLA
jgi:hypothetical protein